MIFQNKSPTRQALFH
jgi:hypothetical protein